MDKIEIDTSSGSKMSPKPALPPLSVSNSSATTKSANPSPSSANLLGSRLSFSTDMLADPKIMLRMVDRVVRNRKGSVLNRQMILKTDHFPTAKDVRIDYHLLGAPNFRVGDLNTFGVAQPTEVGLSTILTFLDCHPTSRKPQSAFWFSAREEPHVYINGIPFVLRDENDMFTTLKTFTGISAQRLEQMEQRLKEDVEKEASFFNGLILVHNETEHERVLPSWISATKVATPKEVYSSFLERGYRIQYARIPISQERAPVLKSFDEYIRIIQELDLTVKLVFNCGMGVGRTTFGMVLALLIRRAMSISQQGPTIDTFLPSPNSPFIPRPTPTSSSRPPQSGNEASQLSLDIEEAQMQNRAMLRLVYVLEQGLESKMSPRSAIEWALASGPVIDNLKNAIMGNYSVIGSLISVLEYGPYIKRLVDRLIDRCDTVINIREVIMMFRVRYSLNGKTMALENAVGSLERYFFLIAIAAYLNLKSSQFSSVTSTPIANGPLPPFSIWLSGRNELGTMIDLLKKGGYRLDLFRPIDDLTFLSDTSGTSSLFGSVHHRGGLVEETHHSRITNELEKYIIKTRHGTVLGPHLILKIDLWGPEIENDKWPTLVGARNFRKILNYNIFAVSQPTMQGFAEVVQKIREMITCTNIQWINLREEPLIYINGIPYVLRDQYSTHKNIKSYAGINTRRLEILEQKLKDDVIKELIEYDQKLLLHGESAEGKVLAIWEDVDDLHIMTLKETVQDMISTLEGNITYSRVPITSEIAPEEQDFDLILQIMCRSNIHETGYVVNCQMGIGRSTTGTVIACLVIRWLKRGAAKSESSLNFDVLDTNQSPKPRITYQIIHSLIRVIRNGLICKRVVDEIIDLCDEHVNLRECIQQLGMDYAGVDDVGKQDILKRGSQCLKRYFKLIAFQAYLSNYPPRSIENLESFQSWFNKRSEFNTMFQELDHVGVESLMSVDELAPGDGIALSSEVLSVVNNRSGSVLARQTILKADAFPGSQRLNLSERIDGAPNFRQFNVSEIHSMFTQHNEKSPPDSVFVSSIAGVGMPTKTALLRVIERMGITKNGSKKLLWTSLREEPVIYVNGKPYVLRMFRDPLKNLEATGIAKETVEAMENTMKADAIRELRMNHGRLLLHEEEVSSDNGFLVIPTWETGKEEDIQTSKDLFQELKDEGYPVDFLRIPITDEQAPIPEVFDLLIKRICSQNGIVDTIYNCQMGRGRTTTGMIITTLIEYILSISQKESWHIELFSKSVEDKEYSVTVENETQRRFLNGEYKIILLLIGVLQNGKISKRITDSAIDLCSHMQNLREAIYDYKLRVESLPNTSQKYKALRNVGINYLIRYFYLITFTDYLLEVTLDYWKNRRKNEDVPFHLAWLVNNENKPMLFSEWLKDRREIISILSASNQDFS